MTIGTSPNADTDTLVRLASLGLQRLRDRRGTGHGHVRETGQPFTYEVRFVETSEIDQLHRLHRLIVDRMPERHLLYHRDHAFFERCCTEGCIAGAWTGGTLIGYAAACFPAGGEHNYGSDVGLPSDQLAHVTHLVGSAVHPTYRGNGLQLQLTTLRGAHAAAAERWHLCGEIVPGNAISLENHLSVGFHLRCHLIDRFDLACYVVHRDTRGEPQRVDSSETRASLRDTEHCRRELERGRWGFGIAWHDRVPLVRFARFRSTET